MTPKNTDILIIGAGLTGLTIAYLLKDSNLNIKIVETRNRVGGRIHTIKSNNNTTIELGATWIQRPHTQLLSLLSELKMEIFEQKIGNTAIYEANTFTPAQDVSLPPNNDPSYRIKGGSINLINTLANFVDAQDILLNQKVEKIEVSKDGLKVVTTNTEFLTKQVISTVPPFLFSNSIQLSTELQDNVKSVLNKTHTWMGESIKVGLVYEKPFWRSTDFIGTVFSNVGPITEFYDHSNFQDSKYALKGFIKNEYAKLTKEKRLEMILRQLKKFYGDQVNDYLSYEELVWSDEVATSMPYVDYVMPHQNNGHKVYQNTYLHSRLFIAGTETAQNFGGYMEGSIRSAQFVANEILKEHQS